MKKAAANYRSANYDQVRFCKSCKFINIEANGCSVVDGRVNYGYVCDYWQQGSGRSTPPRTNPLRIKKNVR